MFENLGGDFDIFLQACLVEGSIAVKGVFGSEVYLISIVVK